MTRCVLFDLILHFVGILKFDITWLQLYKMLVKEDN